MDVLMPQLGETVAEGKIVKWFKAAGDSVKPGENLFEIETDKTSMEVPATSAGTLTDIRFQVGETAKVGAVVAVINDGSAPAASAPAPAAAAHPLPAPRGPRKARPARRRQRGARATASGFPLARERADVRSCIGFRLSQHDRRSAKCARPSAITARPSCRAAPSSPRWRGGLPVSAASIFPISKAPARAAASSPPTSKRPRLPRPAVRWRPARRTAQVKALFEGVAYEEVPLDSMRATIATRLTEAVQTIPTFYLTADLDIGRLLAMREEANDAAPKDKDGQPAFKLSLNDFIIKAWGAALKRVPAANAVWAQDRILRFRHADIGVAVALDGGLITPVLRNVDGKSVTAISAEMRDLAARARDKKLKPNEYQGGASAISNLGMYGMREFTAIINPPQSTILAVGASRRAPVETEDGGVKFVSQMTVTLSCDHRVIDGALGAELLAAFKNLVEMPVTALI